MRSANNGSIVPLVDAVEFADNWNIIEILVECAGSTERGMMGVCGCLPPSRQTHVMPCYVTPVVCVWHARIQQGTQQTSDAYCLQYVMQCTTTRGFYLLIIYGEKTKKIFNNDNDDNDYYVFMDKYNWLYISFSKYKYLCQHVFQYRGNSTKVSHATKNLIYIDTWYTMLAVSSHFLYHVQKHLLVFLHFY